MGYCYPPSTFGRPAACGPSKLSLSPVPKRLISRCASRKISSPPFFSLHHPRRRRQTLILPKAIAVLIYSSFIIRSQSRVASNWPQLTNAMAPNRTRTVKNKHAAPKGALAKGGKRSETDGVSKSKSKKPSGTGQSKQVKERGAADLHKKPKKKVYAESQLDLPKLNMITPVGVTKPKGKKKGKVFADDKVRFLILSTWI